MCGHNRHLESRYPSSEPKSVRTKCRSCAAHYRHHNLGFIYQTAIWILRQSCALFSKQIMPYSRIDTHNTA